MVDSKAPSLSSTAPALVERLDCSSSPVIVGAFVIALKPLDAEGEARKTIGAG